MKKNHHITLIYIPQPNAGDKILKNKHEYWKNNIRDTSIHSLTTCLL